MDDITYPTIENRSLFSKVYNLLYHRTKDTELDEIIANEMDDGADDEEKKEDLTDEQIMKSKKFSIEGILIDSETRAFRVLGDFDVEIEEISCGVASKMHSVNLNLDILYENVVDREAAISAAAFQQLFRKYRSWCQFFLLNFHTGLGIAVKDQPINESLGCHFFLGLLKLQRILTTTRIRGTTMEQQILHHSKVWYFSPFTSDDLNSIERQTILDLTDIGRVDNRTRISDLKRLPSFLGMNKTEPVLQFSLKQLMSAIRLLLQSQKLDMTLMTMKRTRVHVLYYIQMLLLRLGDFVTYQFHTAEERKRLDKPEFVTPCRSQTNLKYVETAMYLWHYLTFIYYYPYRWNNVIEYIPGKLSLPKRFQSRWNPVSNIRCIYKFFGEFLRKRIANRKETCDFFFDQLQKEITIILLPPGQYYYNEVAGQTVPDMWSRHLINDDTRNELLETYLPETFEFTSKYKKLFMDTIDKYPNPERAFDLFVDRFMKGTFYQSESFENNFLNEEQFHLDDTEFFFLPNVRYNLKKKKGRKFQVQYMYAPHMIQCILYIKALQLWFIDLTKRDDFFSNYVVFLHKLFMYPTITIGADMLRKSYYHPIIVQVTLMRFCVMYQQKIYYCNHDIRHTIAVWFLILCCKHQGKLVLDGESFDIVPYIPKDLLYMSGLLSTDDYQGEVEGESDSDEEEEEDTQEISRFSNVDLSSFLQSTKIEDEKIMKFNPISMTGKIHPGLRYVEEGMKVNSTQETKDQHHNGFEMAKINDIIEMRKQHRQTYEEPLSILRSTDSMFQHPTRPSRSLAHPNLEEDVEEEEE